MALSWWEKGLWQICMHHWTVHAKVEFQKCPWDVRPGGAPFHNFGSWTQKLNLQIYIDIFIGFPQLLILNSEIKYIMVYGANLQAISNVTFSKKNIVNEHFQMALSWWEKGLWQICMHHWTVHAKVEFQKCPWDVSLAEVHSTTLDPELRNEFKSFSNLGSLFHNFWSWTDGDKGLWQICMHHWTVHAKVEFQKCPWDVRPWELHSTTLDPELRNEIYIDIFFQSG